MIKTIAGDSAKSAKSLAQQVARQVAREPVEVLKTAGRQVAGTETGQLSEDQTLPQHPGEAEGVKPEQAEKIKVQGQRQLAALEQEIKDIQEKEKQEKIRKVEEEQAAQLAQARQAKEAPLPLTTRPSRQLFGFGKPKKTGELGVQREQRRVESIKPTST